MPTQPANFRPYFPLRRDLNKHSPFFDSRLTVMITDEQFNQANALRRILSLATLDISYISNDPSFI